MEIYKVSSQGTEGLFWCILGVLYNRAADYLNLEADPLRRSDLTRYQNYPKLSFRLAARFLRLENRSALKIRA